MTQGDPLAIITYVIWVLPLIRDLWDAHPHVTQPWYTYDAGGEFGRTLAHFQDLQVRGSLRGYFPEPTKSILVVALRNVARVEEFLRGMGSKVVTWSRYLGGFVGNRAAEDSCLADKVRGWTESVKNLSGVARKQPQSSYAVLQKSLQQKWAFVQWVTPALGASSAQCNRRCGRPSFGTSSRAWEREHQ